MSAVLCLNLLGAYQVELAGQPHRQFKTDKVRALLAYLAVEADHPHERSTLAGLLWPDMPEPSALRNLSQTLVRLRQALSAEAAAPPFLLVTRAAIQFNPASHAQVDVTAFVAAASAGLRARDEAQLAAALALYQGELLPGFALPDSAAFDEWLLLKREYLHRLAVDVAHALTTASLAAGDNAKAQQYAHRQLELDPWHESAHRQLMQALAASGQRAAALLQYEACRRILLADLGVEPEVETTALSARIRAEGWGRREEHEHKRAHSSSSPPSSSLPPHHDWAEAPDLGAFYGRETELALVMRWVAEEGCRVVALVGIGGVGKTALAAQVVQRVAGHFDLVIWRSLLNAPPLAEVLRICLATLSAQALSDWPSSLDEQFDLLLHYLRQRRCLLVLDNLESILQGGEAPAHYRPGYAGYGQLLLRVGQRRHSSCLLLTSREEPPEFDRWLTGDRREGAVRLLTVQGLTGEAAQTLLHKHGVTGSDMASLVQHYAGHPLALKLVADTIRDLYAGDIEAFLSDDTEVFDDIRTVLDEQFRRLSGLEQEILIWLAIERTPATIGILQENLLQTPLRWAILEAVRDLRRRSLIETHGDGFTLQNVVIEFITGRLLEAARQELRVARLDLLCKHALIKAGARAYVRQAQVRLILQPLARWVVSELGETQTRQLISQLLDRLRQAQREHGAGRTGYAAGNLLNLLLETGYTPVGYDFSQVNVWQAYLAERGAPGLNLAQANLSGSVFTDTFASVLRVQFTPDGTRLIAGCADGTIRVWRVADGQLLQVLTGHTGIIWALAISPDGRCLASGGDDRIVRLWDVERGHLLHRLEGHTRSVEALAFRSDGAWLASGGRDQTVRIWEPASGRHLYTLEAHGGVVDSLAFLPQPEQRMRLASGGTDALIRIWDLPGGTLVHEMAGHQRRVCPAFSADGATLATIGAESTVCIWDTQSWQQRLLLRGHTDVITQVVLSADGATVVSGSIDKTVRVWDVQSGQIRRTLQGHTGWVHGVALSPDTVTVASGGSDQTVRIWDTRSGHALHVLFGRINWVPALAFTPTGSTLVSGHWDQMVRVWALGEPGLGESQLRFTLRGHTDRIVSVACSPDGITAASGSADMTIRLWHMPTGQLRQVITGHSGEVTAVAFHPDGVLLASSSRDQTVCIWHIGSGRLLHQLVAHSGQVTAVVFHPAGKWVVSGSADCSILVWDLETGQGHPLGAASTTYRQKIASLAFSLDGARLAVGYGDGTVELRDFATGDLFQRLSAHTQRVGALSFSPDGRYLASCSEDTTIRLWAVDTGEALQAWLAHPIRTMALVFHPQPAAGARTPPLLVSGGCDDLIKIWDSQRAACLQTLRAPGPYEGMNITGVTGISEAQRAALKALGAVENGERALAE